MVCFNPGSMPSVGASAANCSGPRRTGSRRSPDRPQARIAFARRGGDRPGRRQRCRTPQGLQALRDPMRRRQSLMEPPPGPDRPRSGARRTLGRPRQSRRRLHRAGRSGGGVQKSVPGRAGLPADQDRAGGNQVDLRLRRSPHPRPRLPVHARLPRRMAHEKEAGSDPVRQGRSKGRPGAARLASRTRQALPLGPSQGRGQKHAGRDGHAQPPHPARRSLDRRSERRLRRRIRKLQIGRGPDARTKKGIRSPRRQSEEDVPTSWQVGLRESRSCKGKLAFLRREVQSKVTSIDTASLRLSKRLLWLRYIQDHYLGGRRKLARMILVQGF